MEAIKFLREKYVVKIKQEEKMVNKEIQKLTMTEDAEYTKKLSNTIKRIEDYNTGLRIVAIQKQ